MDGNMPLKSAFRILLAIHLVANLLGGMSSPMDEQDNWSIEQGSVAGQDILGLGAVGFVVALLVCLIGLFFFRSWSRPMALFVTFIGLVSTIFIPVMGSSGWQSMLNGLGAICWGAALTMAYATELRFSFR